jgi:hypothetical protein
MAGAGLAITLAYLALERFRYRRDVEHVSNSLREKYENVDRLQAQSSLEHLNEIRWLCRKSCNGHAPSGFMASAYAYLYRRHGDVFFISLLAALNAVILILGVAGVSAISPPVTAHWSIVAAFIVCALAIGCPGAAVLLGRRCRSWGIARARQCDSQITIILRMSALEAVVPQDNAPGLVPQRGMKAPPFRSQSS